MMGGARKHGFLTGVIVGLVFAGLAYLITGLPSAAAIFGVVFGGVTYAIRRLGALDRKAVPGGPVSNDEDEDTTWASDSTSSTIWTPSDDTAPDSGSDGGSCDSGGDGGGSSD